tara:strand:- start:2039 stop:3085 length:1047 start_codon:yes stop_codon:yes gene_type:complete
MTTAYISTSDFLDSDIPGIQKGIGGSDIAAIVGLSPHKSSWDVWASITGRAERFKGNIATETGNELEDWVADVYRRKHSERFVGPTAPYIDGFMRRSPDRLMLESKAVLEVKTSLGYGARNIWPSPDTSPDWVNAQCRWYMAKPYDLRDLASYDDSLNIEKYALLHGHEWVPEYADIAAFVTGPDHLYYRLYHDPDIAEVMLQEADKFWRHHILKDIEPDPEGSSAAAEHIAKRFKESTETMKEPDHTIMPAIQKLAKLDPQRKQLEKECKALQMKIKAFIGEDRGLKGDFGSITWYTQARKRFDKDLAYQRLMSHLPRHVIDDVWKNAITTSESRTFRPTWKKNEHK